MSERDVRTLLARIERALGKEWVEIAEWLRDQNSIDAIEARLLAGDYQGVIDQVEAAARRFATETQDAFFRAGQTEAKWLDNHKLTADKLIRFDITNDRAVRAAQRNELELVQGLGDETRRVVSQVIVDGQRAGLNPRSIARDIRDSITLTPMQAQHVANYRRQLESGDWSGALRRELSDGRSDRTIRRLARDGGELTEAQIDKMVDRYRRNYIAFRAETIARTESARNVHAGLQEAFTQAIERGDIETEQIVREWHAGPNTPNAREQHQAMDGQQVKWGDPFVAPDGTQLMHPGDPRAGAKHTANCRCTMSTTLAG